MRYRIQELKRHPDYHRIMLSGRVSGDGRFLIVGEESPTAKMGVKSPLPSGKARHTPIVAPRRWPLWAWLIGLLRINGDNGVGDTLERIFRRTGIAWGVNWIGKVTGQGCKCKTRRDRLNIFYPYR